MKKNWLKLTGAATLVVALAIAGTGCSDSSITSPSSNSMNLTAPQTAPGPDLGTTQEFPFSFSGKIDKLIPEDGLIVLVEKGMVIRITDDTKALLKQSRTRAGFRFAMVSVGTELTVHGELQSDNSIVAGLVEVLSETSSITQRDDR